MTRIVASLTVAAIAFALAPVLAAGCGNHLTTQEATKTCLDLGKSVPAIKGDVLDACIACFETCEDCELQGTAPETFACPGDDAASSSASGSSSATGSTGTGS